MTARPDANHKPNPRQGRVRGCVVGLAILCAGLNASVAQERPASVPTVRAAALPGLQSVIGELRRGGLVIYFRHGATDPIDHTDTEADMSRCDTQRRLSAAGRAQFVEIGKAFRVLGIGVGTVTSSPFCRCTESAQLAFGRHVPSDDLYFALDAGPVRTRQLSVDLQRRLSTAPPPGLNSVIVAHTANLREATGLWPGEEGMAFVFRPLPGGRFEAIAQILPGDWTPPKPARKAPHAG